MGDRNLTEVVPWTIDTEGSSANLARTELSAVRMLNRLGVEIAPTIDAGQLIEAPEAAPEVVGRYTLGEALGRGGMGVVYDAYDPELRRRVAVKMLRAPTRVSDEGLTRFVSEAQLTAQLQHPNIVPVHDMGMTPGGQVYFVMKRVEGDSLHQILDDERAGQRTGWTQRRLLGVFVQICRALAYAHSKQVLHRDVKPSNIILLLDWGLARAERPEPGVVMGDESSLTLLGSPGYLSPEQARRGARGLDERTDVWGLGGVLYAILALRPPYVGASGEALVAAVRAGGPEDVRSVASGQVADEIAEVCMRAMAHERVDRYAGADALADAVEAFLEGSQRAERAVELMTQARLHLAEAERLTQEAAEQAEAATAFLAAVPLTAPERQKRPGWLLEDTARELEAQGEVAKTRFVQAAHEALQQVPGLEAAHAALADNYRARHETAVQTGDTLAAARLELQLQAHDRGAHSAYLRGHGSFSLRTDPPGARVSLLRIETRARRLHETPIGSIGVTPLQEVSLPFGRYIAVIEATGRAPTRMPFVLEREQSWTWLPPEAAEEGELPLLREHELGKDDIYVPAGWYDVGGDPQGAGALPPRRIWMQGYIIRRFPVAHAEYIEFLDDVTRTRGRDEALRLAPRETSAGETPGALLYEEFEGRFALSGQAPDAAVCNIDWHSAHTYSQWLAARTHRPWRLPSELEWERAARGADGRCFPWGDLHDPSWACTVESHPGDPSPPLLDSYPVDLSPFGVRGMAGGVRDWCLETFAPEGPQILNDRLQLAEPEDSEAPHMTRGGAWSLPDWVARATCRGYHPPIRLADLGMRLARSL